MIWDFYVIFLGMKIYQDEGVFDGIGAAEERVEGNRPVKGATMGFNNF